MKHYFGIANYIKSGKSFSQKYPLSPRKRYQKMFYGALAFYLTGFPIFFFIMHLISPLNLPTTQTRVLISVLAPSALFTFLMVLYALYQKRYFETYFYDVIDGFLIIRKGVFRPQEFKVPIERIVDIYARRSLLDCVFGIFNVYIVTSCYCDISPYCDTYKSNIHIDGVDKKTAHQLRESILNKRSYLHLKKNGYLN